MDSNARVNVNCGREDGRTDGKPDAYIAPCQSSLLFVFLFVFFFLFFFFFFLFLFFLNMCILGQRT